MGHTQPVAGNFYDKYGSSNPVARFLMKRFLADVTSLLLPLASEVNTINEIGCGEGNLTTLIASLGIVRQIRGCDWSEEIIVKAQNTHTDNIDFYVRSIYEVDDSDKADLVVCCEVLEHLERPDDALERLRQITGKYCLLSVPNEPLWRILNMARLRYVSSFGNTPGHLNHWRSNDFIKLVNGYFEIIAVRKPMPWVMVLGRKR